MIRAFTRAGGGSLMQTAFAAEAQTAIQTIERDDSEDEGEDLPPLPRATSLEDYARRFRHFSEDIPDFHREWYAALEVPGENDLILGPRESAKTSVVLTLVEYALLNNLQLRVGIISKTEGAAKAFLREVKRDFEANGDVFRAYGQIKPSVPKVWGNNEIVIAGANHGKDVSIFAVGITGQIPSRRVDLLVLDDIETLETVQTTEARAATRARLAAEVFPIVSPGGKVVCVGTRKHDDDCYGWMIRGGGWRIVDNCTRAILPTGASYWPLKWSLQALGVKKAQLDAMNIRAWSSEYMNTIVPPETRMFDPEKWPMWYTLPEDCVCYEAWDLAISEKTSADYTVGVVIAVDRDANIYIVHMVRARWDFHRTQQEIARLGLVPEALGFPLIQVGIEAVQYQSAAVQEGLRTTQLPIRPILAGRGRAGSVSGLRGQTSDNRTLGGDKVTRARLLEARSSQGKVFKPGRPVPWWPDAAQELSFFPESTHDDITDALGYAVAAAAAGAQAEEWSRHVDEMVPDCPSCGNPTFDFGDRPLYCPQCGTVVRSEA